VRDTQPQTPAAHEGGCLGCCDCSGEAVPNKRDKPDLDLSGPMIGNLDS
jgi:hypothetical protein